MAFKLLSRKRLGCITALYPGACNCPSPQKNFKYLQILRPTHRHHGRSWMGVTHAHLWLRHCWEYFTVIT